MPSPGRPSKSTRPREALGLAVVQALARARREAKMTRHELAAVSGISSNTIAKIEQAAISDPGFTAVTAIATALGMDLNVLAAQTGAHRPAAPD